MKTKLIIKSNEINNFKNKFLKLSVVFRDSRLLKSVLVRKYSGKMRHKIHFTLIFIQNDIFSLKLSLFKVQTMSGHDMTFFTAFIQYFKFSMKTWIQLLF